jgi:hypothetical protein
MQIKSTPIGNPRTPNIIKASSTNKKGPSGYENMQTQK